MSEKIEAYKLACLAAELDFESALNGLLAGHKSAMQKIERERAGADMAFLAALSLTEKGARLDRDGALASKIAEGISKVNMCITEKKFVERVAK